MDVRLTWTDCYEAGDYVVPNVLSPRDLVSRPDNMDETVLHISTRGPNARRLKWKSRAYIAVVDDKNCHVNFHANLFLSLC